MMTRMFRFAQFSTVVVFTFGFVSAFVFAFASSQSHAQQSETQDGPMRPIARLALLGDDYRTAKKATATAATADSSEPVPFSISTMANDIVPPFAGFPTLTPATTGTSELKVSFKENMPVKSSSSTNGDSIDDCCRELTEMIAGNLDTEISLDAKKRMIETALKMVARNVALKAESKITKLKADHALQMARIQTQMGQMRSTTSAVDQINRVAGPLSEMLNRNYQQAMAMNIGNQKLSSTLAQLGYQQLEEEARVARANRQRIQLTTPANSMVAQNRYRQDSENQWRVNELTQQLARLQRQLEAQNTKRPATNRNVRPATYNRPLQPRRQPLEPLGQLESLPQRQTNEYFDTNHYQQLPRQQR